jgi:hypothetical protein
MYLGCRYCIELQTAVGCTAYSIHNGEYARCRVETCPLVHPELLLIEK